MPTSVRNTQPFLASTPVFSGLPLDPRPSDALLAGNRDLSGIRQVIAQDVRASP